MDKPILHGLYIIKDSYFEEFPSPFWTDNKGETRPHYYVIQDHDGIDWVIPMSSKVAHHREKIAREEAKRGEGNCVYYHIAKVASRESVFKIGNMFPIAPDYVREPYTIGTIHYIVQNKKLNSEIYSKAMRYLSLLESGTLQSITDVLAIKNVLMNRRNNETYIL